MPIFEVTKPIHTFLRIKCKSKIEAEKWASKIVATIEMDNEDLLSQELDFFEAESVENEMKIEEIKVRHDY